MFLLVCIEKFVALLAYLIWGSVFSVTICQMAISSEVLWSKHFSTIASTIFPEGANCGVQLYLLATCCN